MYYTINISLKGSHFFATADRSITDREKLKKVYTALKAAFPETEGYEFSLTQWKTTGTIFNEKEI